MTKYTLITLTNRSEKVKNYKNIALLVADIKSGKIPAEVVSPGQAAAVLGVGRQAIWNRIHVTKTLEAWGADGVVLISEASLRLARKKQQNIPEQQGELHV
jgi:biotin operon repressor